MLCDISWLVLVYVGCPWFSLHVHHSLFARYVLETASTLQWPESHHICWIIWNLGTQFQRALNSQYSDIRSRVEVEFNLILNEPKEIKLLESSGRQAKRDRFHVGGYFCSRFFHFFYACAVSLLQNCNHPWYLHSSMIVPLARLVYKYE